MSKPIFERTFLKVEELIFDGISHTEADVIARRMMRDLNHDGRHTEVLEKVEVFARYVNFNRSQVVVTFHPYKVDGKVPVKYHPIDRGTLREASRLASKYHKILQPFEL